MNNKKLLIKNLLDYVIDHLKHFKCYPMEFEYKNKVYSFNEIQELLKYRKVIKK
jgi:hypothetical protein